MKRPTFFSQAVWRHQSQGMQRVNMQSLYSATLTNREEGQKERRRGGEREGGREGERRREEETEQGKAGGVVPGVGLPKAEGKAENGEYVVSHR